MIIMANLLEKNAAVGIISVNLRKVTNFFFPGGKFYRADRK